MLRASAGSALFSAGLLVGVIGAALTFALQSLLRRRWHRSDATMPSESTIRLMTRLALRHKAINLSQGFPNEPPPAEMVLHAAGALLAGESAESAARMAERLRPLLEQSSGCKDALNQYTFPAGLPALREQISRHCAHYQPAVPADADENVTVVLGATEGFAVVLRALCEPGDAVVFFQPFHELYPSQCLLWGLRPRAVTLRECELEGGWAYERAELRAAMRGAKLLLLNTPHNPTGKVFDRVELREIAALCVELDVLCVTDEIYQFVTYGRPHHCLAALDARMADRTCVVNAVSKSASATGWRIGWVVSPAHLTPAIRACHDQLVVQAPTPLQHGAAALLALGPPFFEAVGAKYLPRRDLLVAALRAARFSVRAPPDGAYYVFAGYADVPALRGLAPREAAMAMTERHGVACVPGDNFYLGAARADPRAGGRYLRFAFVRSLDVLQAAAERLGAMAGATR